VSSFLRAGGGGDAKPRWTLPAADYHKHTYQPSIPDKHFNGAHWNYVPITMWLRARRPAMEKVICDVWGTLKCTAVSIWTPVQGVIDANLPGFGLKVFGFIGMLLGYNLFVSYVHNRTEAYFFLEKMKLYKLGDDLTNQGFFRSDAEEEEHRQHGFDHDVERLNSLWETAITDATQARSFDKLCEHLEVDHNHIEEIPKPVSWRFSMMPYGRENPDTQTVGFAPVDQHKSSTFFLLDMGSTGDYCDRQDNKSNPIRKGRHMYTSAYMPPTK
jgi:hypothetical protein